MADGPHRSLNMRRAWKQLAERADRTSFEPEDVLVTLPAALEQDWRAEVPQSLCRKIRDILNDRESTLFPDIVTRLESLRTHATGLPLSDMLLDGTMMALAKGYAGDAALTEGARVALSCRAASGARQVEEHYFRESTKHRATHVRKRIESALSQADLVTTARRVTSNDIPAPRRPLRKMGVDDGVRLSSGRPHHA